MVVTALGAFFAVKFGQQEQQRLLLALHKRFDTLEEKVEGIQLEQVRLDERLKAQALVIAEIKQSQRFKLREAE